MSAYSSGVEAYRSTVRWLVAFVPTAAVTAAVIAAGPTFAERISNEGVGDALASRTIVGVLLIGGGLVAIVAVGLGVLSAQTEDLAQLPASDVDRAFGAGIGAPHFTDAETYREKTQAVQSWVDHQRERRDREAGTGATPTGAEPTRPGDDELKALAAAEEAVRDWTLHDRTTRKFRCFLYTFWPSTAVMLIGLLVVAGDETDAEERRDPPVAVSVDMTEDRFAEMVELTGCELQSIDELDSASFWLVAGDFADPVLQVDGDGCAFDGNWEPSSGVRVRPTSD